MLSCVVCLFCLKTDQREQLTVMGNGLIKVGLLHSVAVVHIVASGC